MATTLSSQVQASCQWTLSTTPAGYTKAIPAGNTFSYDSGVLTNGVGAGAADLIYASQLSIAASGNSVINIRGTPTTDPFGNNIVMIRLKYLYINLTTTTTASSVTVGNATNPLALYSAGTTTQSVRNGGIMVFGVADATGIAVASGSTDQLKIVNADSSNVATCNVAIIGASA
jgi:hypothetical protein